MTTAAPAFAPIHPGDVVSDAAARRIIDGLRDLTLPKLEWTHGAHLCAGTALVTELGLRGAEVAMPGMIRAYNEATGVPNTDHEGYHHSITLFYLRALDAFLARDSECALGACCTSVLAAPIADRGYPLTRYSPARLFSVAARRGWIEPDLPAE